MGARARGAGAGGGGAVSRDLETLFDADDTLLDNDRAERDMRAFLEREVAGPCRGDFWRRFEALRAEREVADYLGALQQCLDEDPGDPGLLAFRSYLLDYPWAERVYPGALDAIAHAAGWGGTAIVSDGEPAYQGRKIERSGLADAVGGRVLITRHKERELDEVERRFPALRYVLVDDKRRILAACKEAWGDRVTTVGVRQGHYANAPEADRYPAPDVALERIGDLARIDLAGRPGAARALEGT